MSPLYAPPLALLSTTFLLCCGAAWAAAPPTTGGAATPEATTATPQATTATPEATAATPPAVTVAAPPPPDPQQVWETTRLQRVPLPDGWTVRAGDHTFNAVEFAAITGDHSAVEAFRDGERGAYRATRSLVVVGGLLAGLSIAEFVAWRTTTWQDPDLAEDHLWRSATLGVSAVLPLTFCTLPVRIEAGRRAVIAANYDVDEVDDRITTYNTRLRDQLGLPLPAGAPPTAVILAAPEGP